MAPQATDEGETASSLHTKSASYTWIDLHFQIQTYKRETYAKAFPFEGEENCKQFGAAGDG